MASSFDLDAAPEASASAASLPFSHSFKYEAVTCRIETTIFNIKKDP